MCGGREGREGDCEIMPYRGMLELRQQNLVISYINSIGCTVNISMHSDVEFVNAKNTPNKQKISTPLFIVYSVLVTFLFAVTTYQGMNGLFWLIVGGYVHHEGEGIAS